MVIRRSSAGISRISALVQVVLPEPVGPETRMFLRASDRQAHERLVVLRLQEPQELAVPSHRAPSLDAAGGPEDPAPRELTRSTRPRSEGRRMRDGDGARRSSPAAARSECARRSGARRRGAAILHRSAAGWSSRRASRAAGTSRSPQTAAARARQPCAGLEERLARAVDAQLGDFRVVEDRPQRAQVELERGGSQAERASSPVTACSLRRRSAALATRSS